MTTTILSTTEVRNALRVTERVVNYTLAARPELEPPRVGGRRAWGPEHVEALREALAKRPRRGAIAVAATVTSGAAA